MKYKFGGEHIGTRYNIGDRVKCIAEYPGLSIGDLGTYLGENKGWGDASIRWDKRDDAKHDCNGLCEYGHGWFVPFNKIAQDRPIDLGELPLFDTSTAISDILFGGAT